jgi:Fe-S-cluster containining protein
MGASVQDAGATWQMSEEYCQNCGECCLDLHFMIAPVDVGEVDIREFYDARGIEVEETRGLLWAIVPHRCPHLTEDNMCDIYESRPASCRKYDGRLRLLTNCRARE